MESKSVRIRYRPIRIGWCVETGNTNEFRRAVRLSHTLAGGRFNPIIPIGSPVAADLIRHFRVDILFPIETTDESVRFLAQFPYLAAPFFKPNIFDNYMGRIEPNYLDISQWLDEIVRHIGRPQYNLDQEGVQAPESNPFGLVHWAQEDPLADVLLATFGGYPPPIGIGRDYLRFIIDNIRPAIYDAKPDEVIPSYLLRQTTPSILTAAKLNWDRVPSTRQMGFYAGLADDFVDLVNYWNMRAADVNVLFLDPGHLNRLEPLREDHIKFIFQHDMSPESPRTINLWSREQELAGKVGIDPSALPYFTVVTDVSSIGPAIRPPLYYFQNRTVLASVSESSSGPTLAIQLPDKPFAVHEEFSQQHLVVSLDSPIESVDDEFTLWTPYIPELNHWYGRQLITDSQTFRVEIDGLGIIRPITDEQLNISLLKKQALVEKLFDHAGIKAEPSVPGKIASRLITQLGGLHNCRVLKIAGVRKLIKEYGLLKEFDRTAAIGCIGNLDPVSGQPSFAKYEGLHIDSQANYRSKLKPGDTFLYLLDKGVFRVGLTLTCTICELPFWAPLDDIGEMMRCDVCGNRFDIKRQLKDRGWMYRRSGLFGKENNQEGSIPVALTLQQLAANVRSPYSHSLFLTNMSLRPGTAPISRCETDLFIAMLGHWGIQIVIGECKDAGGAITADDAKKMSAVADAFPKDIFEPYILFSKTGAFTPDDVVSCRLAQAEHERSRVIMLTDEQLERERIFEVTDEQVRIRGTSASLENMAEFTRETYFPEKFSQLPPVYSDD